MQKGQLVRTLKKRDAIDAIRRKCVECRHLEEKANCIGCPLEQWRGDPNKNLDLLRENDIDVFMATVELMAATFGGCAFYWSELRERVGVEPVVSNWWGAATKRLHSMGFRVVEGHQASEHLTRKGAQDRRWQKTV